MTEDKDVAVEVTDKPTDEKPVETNPDPETPEVVEPGEGDEAAPEETPVESPDAAYQRGRAEAAIELAKGGKPGREESVPEEIDAEIEALKAKRVAIVIDQYDEPTELAKKVAEREALADQIADKREAKQKAAAKVEQDDANAEAHQSALKDVMARPDIKLPPSSFKALDKAVRSRFEREGYTAARPPSLLHYQAAVEAEALKLKHAPKPQPVKATPKPSVTPGSPADPAFDVIKPGKPRDVRAQMKKLFG